MNRKRIEGTQSSVGVVLVTYNRMAKLKNALAAYESQEFKPCWIIVVDNASTDGTAELLEQWEAGSAHDCEHVVVRASENLGGAGGFALGMRSAIDRASDWIWLADDDAYPECHVFALLENHLQDGRFEDCAALCSSVLCGGGIDITHRRRMMLAGLNLREVPVPLEEYTEPFEFDALSFVGAIVKRSAVERVGLPESHYFIWYDDTEYSMRLRTQGKLMCLPDLKVEHDVPGDSGDVSWKDYYGIRNSLDMIRRHYSPPVFFYNWVRAFIKAMTTGHEHGMAYRRLRVTALKDVLFGKRGMHSVYKPGWSVAPLSDRL